MNIPEVIDALLTEQQQLMAMKLQGVAAASGAERQSLFDDYLRFLAAHQGAEQVWLYGGRGPAPTTKAADIQMDGQKDVGRLISQLEGLDIDSDTFDDRFGQLTRRVVAQAPEERQQLAALMGHCSDGEGQLMVRALQQVPAMAAGNGHGHGATMADRFTFADLLDQAKTHFAAMPLIDSASTTVLEPQYRAAQ